MSKLLSVDPFRQAIQAYLPGSIISLQDASAPAALRTGFHVAVRGCSGPARGGGLVRGFFGGGGVGPPPPTQDAWETRRGDASSKNFLNRYKVLIHTPFHTHEQRNHYNNIVRRKNSDAGHIGGAPCQCHSAPPYSTLRCIGLPILSQANCMRCPAHR